MKKSISLLLSVILVVAMTSFPFAIDLKNVTDDTKYVKSPKSNTNYDICVTVNPLE